MRASNVELAQFFFIDHLLLSGWQVGLSHIILSYIQADNGSEMVITQADNTHGLHSI